MELETNTQTITRSQYQTIRDAVEDNYRIFKEQKELGRWTPNQFWVIDKDLHVGKVSSLKATRKVDDFYAAAAIGAIVIDAQHGDDAIIIKDKNTIEFIELKLSIKSKDDCWLFDLSDEEILATTNPRFTLYVGDKKSENPQSFKSSSGGTYEIANNLTSKNRTTYFVLLEDDTLDTIDVRMMTGEAVIALLSKSDARKRFISYKQFVDNGEAVDTHLGQIGFEKWSEDIVGPMKKKFFERREMLLANLSYEERMKREKLDRKNVYSLQRRKAA